MGEDERVNGKDPAESGTVGESGPAEPEVSASAEVSPETASLPPSVAPPPPAGKPRKRRRRRWVMALAITGAAIVILIIASFVTAH